MSLFFKRSNKSWIKNSIRENESELTVKKTTTIAIIASLTLPACFILSKNSQQISYNNTALALQSGEVNPQNIVFPKDSGVINVKDAPYNAKGDGITDDTAAIQKALSQYPNGNKIIYLPKGTYLVSDKLKMVLW